MKFYNTLITVLATAVLIPSAKLHAQYPGRAIVDDSTDDPGWHQGANYDNFEARAPVEWNPYLAGKGGIHDGNWYQGMNWVPYGGSDMIQTATAYGGFDIIMNYRSGEAFDQNVVSAAIDSGIAIFSDYNHSNQRNSYYDYRTVTDSILGRGPVLAMTVSGGYHYDSGAETGYGPQMEFFDAVDDSGGDDAQSYADSATAARYARLKSMPLHSSWNVYDVRQLLRQACTSYQSGWNIYAGYGFPLVTNRIGDSFQDTTVNGKQLENVDLADLDAGPPIQPSAQVTADGNKVTFRWHNFRQTGFQSTLIKVNGSVIYEGTDNSTSWTPNVSGSAMAEFFTKVNIAGTTRISRGAQWEPYTRVPVRGISTEPIACVCVSSAEFSVDQVLGNHFSFVVTGIPGGYWDIYSSTDLEHWQQIGGVTLTSAVTIDDSIPDSVNYRFYRVANSNCCSRVIGFTRFTYGSNSTNAIANPFDSASITINSLLNPMADGSYLPDGTMLWKWDGNQYIYYTWNSLTQLWNPDGGATLGPGEGAFLVTPISRSATITFAGLLRDSPQVLPIATGQYLYSSIVPKAGAVSSILGYTPHSGDHVIKWGGTGFLPQYTYSSSLGWLPSEPLINVGESFFIKVNLNNSWEQQVNYCSQPTICTPPTLNGNLPTGNQSFILTISGPKGSRWNVRSSTDLTTWTLLAAITLDAKSGQWTTSDPLNGANFRFYRADNGECCSQIAGFTRFSYSAGSSNVIANYFDRNDGTSIGTVFKPNLLALPDGLQLWKWDGAQYLPYIWSATTHTWSPDANTTLSPGEGAFLVTPTGASATITFTGYLRDVPQVNSIITGQYLYSSLVPKAGGLTSVLGYTPNSGDKVIRWGGTAFLPQYTYSSSLGWLPSEPLINVGESFFIKVNSNNTWQQNVSLCH